MILTPDGRYVFSPQSLKSFEDQGGVTSKGRLKISTFESIFFNTFQYGKETDVWDEATASGGAGTFDANLNAIAMSVTGTAGSQVIRQTFNAQRYNPSRPSTLSFAVRLTAPTTGVRRRFGLFDENNGFYFEDGGDGDYYCVIRSSASGTMQETRVGRNQWNGDRLTGYWPSWITADPTALQLVNFDYEWYGAGQVKVGWIIDGEVRIIHTFSSANRQALPWCSTPFLPIRLELTNVAGTAGTHYMYQGSNSLISEGMTDKLGIAQNITSPTAGTDITTGSFKPVLSIRLKSTALKGIVIPRFYQCATLDNTNIFYRLTRNPTLTGASWTNMPDANSFSQYDISATETTSGTIIDSGFITANSNSGQIKLDEKTIYQIGRSSLGTISDILSLSIESTSANKKGIASMTWIEQR